MKQILFALSVLAIVSCDPRKSGNKDILPAPSETNNSEESVTTNSTENSEAKNIAKGELDTNGNFIYSVGELIDVNLPNGDTLNVGKNSTENKLFSFLSDNNQKVSEDKTKGWVTLDRVYFNTGSSNLTEKSEKQIDNIYKILKAYPNAIVKIGGYTDNTGSAEANQAVSQKRAEAVKSILEHKGIAANRITAEGYGQEHPICPTNDTDECKAQNRRVDIRIVEK